MLSLELLSQIQAGRGQELHIILIDLQKAFDSVDREILFEMLQESGIDETVTDLLKSAYAGEKSTLMLNGERTEPFNIEKGVRQGACTSPILFNLVPDKLAKQLEGMNTGIVIDDGPPINCLMYADDIALVAKNSADVQRLADET